MMLNALQNGHICSNNRQELSAEFSLHKMRPFGCSKIAELQRLKALAGSRCKRATVAPETNAGAALMPNWN
jgi:hypothetical protein